MTKVTLTDVGSLIDVTSAQTTINDNSAAIVTAVENTLSRDGTAPNQMQSPLDMNSNQILNLPAPLSTASPLRLGDYQTLSGGGTVSLLPAGGVTGQGLEKKSNTDYDVQWGNKVTSVGLALPADFTITGSPVVGSGTLTGAWQTTPTGAGAVVRASGPTLVAPLLGTPTSGNLSNCTNLPVTTVTGMGTGVNTFLVTPTSANLRAAITDETGTGSAVFNTSPSLTTPVITGISSGVEPSAGILGQFVSSSVAAGSAVSITTGVAANVTSISLTAGIWLVSGSVGYAPAGITVITAALGAIGTTSATLPTAPAAGAEFSLTLTFPAGQGPLFPVGMTRLNLASTTTVYLVAVSNFTTSTNAAYGFIGATRIA